MIWHTLFVVPILQGIHHRLRGAGSAHLGQRPSVPEREATLRILWDSVAGPVDISAYPRSVAAWV
jgi:hypothetical protein